MHVYRLTQKKSLARTKTICVSVNDYQQRAICLQSIFSVLCSRASRFLEDQLKIAHEVPTRSRKSISFPFARNIGAPSLGRGPVTRRFYGLTTIVGKQKRHKTSVAWRTSSMDSSKLRTKKFPKKLSVRYAIDKIS